MLWAAAFSVVCAASAAAESAKSVAAKTKTTKPPVSTARAVAKPVATTRMLDPIHIEGELDVPEVLFITARDQRRIVGFQHARYLSGSRDIARSTPLPSHVVVDRKAPPAAPEGSK